MKAHEVPCLTATLMREVDRLATEEFHLDLLQMMENAGRALARLARDRFLGGSALGRRVLILAGPGGNGGGGLAAARRLDAWGAKVEVILGADVNSLKAVPAHQLRALRSVSVPIRQPGSDLPQAELVLDALLGYSLRGAPRDPIAGMIAAANAGAAPILALDLPSGLDPDTGLPGDPTVRAAATLTLALPKAGLLTEGAREYVGDLWLADIGIPPELYRRLGLRVPPIFAADDLLHLDP